jgi:voltage-gated potassium channel Kch
MPFLVGSLASLCNIVIHACVMTSVIRVARAAGQNYKGRRSLLLVVVMIPTISIFMAAHALEVIVWAITYSLVGATPAGRDLIYFAGVTFTTLGYGDVVPVTEWKLLAPITAMNGVLLFGWSTAVIFEVLRRALALVDRDGPSNTNI